MPTTTSIYAIDQIHEVYGLPLVVCHQPRSTTATLNITQNEFVWHLTNKNEVIMDQQQQQTTTPPPTPPPTTTTTTTTTTPPPTGTTTKNILKQASEEVFRCFALCRLVRKDALTPGNFHKIIQHYETCELNENIINEILSRPSDSIWMSMVHADTYFGRIFFNIVETKKGMLFVVCYLLFVICYSLFFVCYLFFVVCL